MLLDTVSSVFVWVGSQASETERAEVGYDKTVVVGVRYVRYTRMPSYAWTCNVPKKRVLVSFFFVCVCRGMYLYIYHSVFIYIYHSLFNLFGFWFMFFLVFFVCLFVCFWSCLACVYGRYCCHVIQRIVDTPPKCWNHIGSALQPMNQQIDCHTCNTSQENRDRWLRAMSKVCRDNIILTTPFFSPENHPFFF